MFDIDITEAARAYGLRDDQVPPIVIEDSRDETTGSPAWLDARDHKIHVLVDPDNLATDYTLGRIQRVTEPQDIGLGDRLRFIIAHELYHAVQALTPAGEFVNQIDLYLMHIGQIEHDWSPSEIAADAAAATVFTLVKINGKPGTATMEPSTNDAMERFSEWVALGADRQRAVDGLDDLLRMLSDKYRWLYRVTYTTRASDDGSFTSDHMLVRANDSSEARTLALNWLDDTSQAETVSVEVNPA